LYRWVSTEVATDERPSPAVIEDDAEFDKWLEAFERKKAQETAALKAQRKKPHG
jgi:hypothetical protein